MTADPRERYFNAGFDALGAAMKVRGWRADHPQSIRDRAEAFRKHVAAEDDRFINGAGKPGDPPPVGLRKGIK